MSRYYKPNNSTVLYLNSSFNCIKSSSITVTKATGGTGYTISKPASQYVVFISDTYSSNMN